MRSFSKVEFHSPIFAAGVNIGKCLPAANKTFKELHMIFTPEGMIIKINDPSYKIINAEIIVPWANVVWAAYLPEEKPIAVKK